MQDSSIKKLDCYLSYLSIERNKILFTRNGVYKKYNSPFSQKNCKDTPTSKVAR